MSSLYDETQKGKRIYLYRNGDATFFGKPLVVNPRQIRNVDALLSVATNHLGMPEQVREIRTPDQGRYVVKSIEDLVKNQAYVAVGNGRFIRMQYTALQDDHELKLQVLRRKREKMLKIPPRKAPITPAYMSNIADGPQQKEVLVILVYANGDMYTAARKIVLRPRILKSWISILSEIDDVLKPAFGPVTKLYTLEGDPVADSRSLVSGHYYVAAGRFSAFKKVPYGNERKFIVQYTVPRQPYDSLFLTQSAAALHGEAVTVGLSPREPPSRQQQDRGPMDPQDEQSASLLKYADGSEVFPRKPKRHRRKQKKKKRRVFRMKKDRAEVIGAEEGSEEHLYSRHDPPFSDIQEADEIHEEEIESETPTEQYRYNATPPPEPRPQNATGNARVRARRITPHPNTQSTAKRESGVGPSGSPKSPDHPDAEEFEIFRNIDFGKMAKESEGGESERRKDSAGREGTSHDDEDDISTGRQAESREVTGGYKAYDRDRRRDEAARKIQRAYKKGRRSADQGHYQGQHQGHRASEGLPQLFENKDLKPYADDDATLEQRVPGEVKSYTAEQKAVDGGTAMQAPTAGQVPNGRIKGRSSIPTRKQVE